MRVNINEHLIKTLLKNKKKFRKYFFYKNNKTEIIEENNIIYRIISIKNKQIYRKIFECCNLIKLNWIFDKKNKKIFTVKNKSYTLKNNKKCIKNNKHHTKNNGLIKDDRLIKDKYISIRKLLFVNNNWTKYKIKDKLILFRKDLSITEITEPILNKIIVKFCVFLGREKNMKILHVYIEQGLTLKILDEYHMFDFSRNISDHNFIYEEYTRLINLYPQQIFLHNFETNSSTINNKTDWSPFYKIISNEINDNDVIIKCDDDILFIDIYSLKNAINDRINDKVSFLIHSNCINNNVCTYYQRNNFDKLKEKISIYPQGGLLGILFEKPEIAYAIHNQFTNDLLNDITTLNKYIIEDVYINTRISINFILLNGSDVKYLKDVGFDDEYELSSFFPEKLLRPNKIKGDLITAHLSYSFQEKFILNKDIVLNNYKKISDKYINYLAHFDKFINNYNKIISNNLIRPLIKNNIYNIKNWNSNYSYYIKNVETGKYLYIDYANDEFSLSDNKTVFDIIKLKDSLDKIEIKLGIYYMTKYNSKGKFRNENIFFKYIKDESEREIIKEDIDNNSFFIKFSKYNSYLSINIKNDNFLDITSKKTNRWIFEKDDTKEYINVKRYIKNKKFYYKNIDNNIVFTNYYMGWGYENIISFSTN